MYNELYLNMVYDIIKVDNDIYLLPENKIEIGVDNLDDSDMSELQNVDIENLQLRNGDTLIVTLAKKSEGIYDLLRIENPRNGTYGLVSAYYYSDDGRCYTMYAIANLFKNKVKHLTLKNYLIYNEKEITEYVNAIEEIWNE